MKKMMLLNALLLIVSACSNADSLYTSKGLCKNIPCKSCRQQDSMIQIHCEMVGGEFQPVASSWLSRF